MSLWSKIIKFFNTEPIGWNAPLSIKIHNRELTLLNPRGKVLEHVLLDDILEIKFAIFSSSYYDQTQKFIDIISSDKTFSFPRTTQNINALSDHFKLNIPYSYHSINHQDVCFTIWKK